jgi:peptidyl-prolyl cis-trans isomerase C
MADVLQLRWWEQVRHSVVLAAAGVLLAAASPAAAPAGGKAAAQPPKTEAANPKDERTDQPGSAVEMAPNTGTDDHVIASVEGHLVYLSELGAAERKLPANMRNMPLAQLYPVLLNLLVDHQALAMLARRRGLDSTPAVKQQIQEATDRILEGTLLGQDAAPKVTEDAIKARYDQLYRSAAPIAQVHARHILVGTEAEATRIIAELKNGGDFATLARQDSKDADGERGGDLGFLSRDQMPPGFGDVAFLLQPGQVADKPVHNEFGWHVVKVEERRMQPPPTLAQAHDALRTQLMQEAVKQEVALARGQLTIHEWNLNGTPLDPGQPPASTVAKPR